jgi:flagellar biosynthesis protein FliR
MSKETTSASSNVWDAIEAERRRDRLLRRVAVSAWIITLVFVIALAVLVSFQVAQMARAAMVGAVPWMSVMGVAMPLIIVLGLLSVLVASLSTIGMFLRMRTASLTEIQLRLAALETMITAGRDSERQ